MRALVVYESMSGSTREVAESIASGLRSTLDVCLSRADEVMTADSGALELIVAGGPTHARSTTAPAPRQEHASWAEAFAGGLEPDQPGTAGGGRDWFDDLAAVPPLFAAFDTCADIPKLLTGAASVRIGRELRLRGSTPVVPPESFLVTDSAGLQPGEADRARFWGEQVAEAARRAMPRTATETPT